MSRASPFLFATLLGLCALLSLNTFAGPQEVAGPDDDGVSDVADVADGGHVDSGDVEMPALEATIFDDGARESTSAGLPICVYAGAPSEGSEAPAQLVPPSIAGDESLELNLITASVADNPTESTVWSGTDYSGSAA